MFQLTRTGLLTLWCFASGCILFHDPSDPGSEDSIQAGSSAGGSGGGSSGRDAGSAGSTGAASGGSTGRNDAGVAPSACPASAADNACVSCGKQGCCTEAVACTRTQACLALVDCRSKCVASDTGCLTRCAQTHPSGVPGLNALAQCLQDKCRAACSAAGARRVDGSP